jgi:molecular chaperone HtpG
MTTQRAEQHAFAAEVDQVLSIVVNSLYSHREVFLRELISNASDALDKLSFEALTDASLLGDDKQLRIEIEVDEDQKTLTIRDNGVGMSHDELVQNLGTIARSGSRQLMNALAAKGGKDENLSLIGQFGVGFYSAFLVADRVVVTSRRVGSDEAWRWESEAKEGFTIEPATRDARGTEIVLHLKDDAEDFMRSWEVRSLVRKYSDYVRHPIRMKTETEEDGEKKTDWETVNQASALWTRPKSEITDEQYAEFYKHLGHDWNDPLAWTHFKVEGTQEMTGLLFVPGQAPMDLFERTNRGVKLFVKRVFIMEDCEELLPEWLRFMRGVVDSEDLPLNVSRELLQQDRATRAIRKQVIKKSLTLLQELADEGVTKVEEAGEDGEKTEVERNRYETFWKAFGRVLKEGIHFDPEHKDEIAALLRFESTREDGLTSLHDYLGRMEPDQPGIYYVTGDGLSACRNSPHLEALKARGYEVLYMADPIDEWVLQRLEDFEEKKLISAAKGALDLPETEEEKKAHEEQEKKLEGLVGSVKEALADKVKDVRLSHRLKDSPACLVSDEWDMSPHLERILRANGQQVPDQKRTLELNPDHPVVQALDRMATDGSADLGSWSSMLYDQALLAEGTMPKDPAAFARQVADLMQKAAR